MFTEIAKGVVDGVAGLVGVKSEERESARGSSQEPARRPVDESVASAVAEEVGLVLGAAEESAGRIVADAREEAARIIADARRQAAMIVDAGRQSIAEEAPAADAETDVTSAPEAIEAVEAASAVDAVEPEPAVDAKTAAATDGAPTRPAPGQATDAAQPDEAAVRLVVMNMALGGTPKAEIAAQVEAELGVVPNLDEVIDEVLARTG